jgi:hypothetical protein
MSGCLFHAYVLDKVILGLVGPSLTSVARKSSLLWQPQESCAGSRPTLLSKEQSKVLSYGKMSRNPMAFFSLGFHKVENALEVPPSKGARGLENLFCPRWGMGTSGTSAKTHS